MKPQIGAMLLAGLLTIVTPHPCSARIGETLDECQLRYGVLVRVNAGDGKFHPEYPQYCYRMGDVEIRVRIYNGLSAQELYAGVEGKNLTRAQIDEILAINRESDHPAKWEIDYGRNGRTDILVLMTEEFGKVWRKGSGSGF